MPGVSSIPGIAVLCARRKSALGLQRMLGLGSYKNAWAMLHKLRRAMVRPGRDRLRGVVEVDNTYWGGEEEGVVGRLTEDQAVIAVAAEEDGKGIGRVRLRPIPDVTKASLHSFITQVIDPGSTARTDGLNAYLGLRGYTHDRQIQRRQPKGEHLLPRVHRAVSLLKRWLLGAHQGAFGHDHLDYHLEQFTFRFNRRKSASRGKLFYHLAQQAVQVEPVPFQSLVKPQPIAGGWGKSILPLRNGRKGECRLGLSTLYPQKLLRFVFKQVLEARSANLSVTTCVQRC